MIVPPLLPVSQGDVRLVLAEEVPGDGVHIHRGVSLDDTHNVHEQAVTRHAHNVTALPDCRRN